MLSKLVKLLQHCDLLVIFRVREREKNNNIVESSKTAHIYLQNIIRKCKMKMKKLEKRK